MADLNKVFLMGRLTFDPELRRTPSGTAVTELRLATSRMWTGRDGERKEETLFIDVTVWDRQAETCCQYLRKGSSVHVEGSLKMDTWDDKTTGEKRSKIRVHADRVQFLDRRESSGGSDDEPGPSAAREAPSRRSAAPGGPPTAGNGPGPARGGNEPPAGAAPRSPAPAPEPESAEGDDDDIPF
jgi:single-strand DNA-binding protein